MKYCIFLIVAVLYALFFCLYFYEIVYMQMFQVQ